MFVASVICAAVLLWSATAKLIARHSAPAALRGLDLPNVWVLRAAVTVLPLVEISLGASWILVPAPFAVVPAAAATALFLLFLLLVVRSRIRRADASCMCFGAERTIGIATVLRNIALVGLGVSSIIAISAQLMPGMSVMGALAAADAPTFVVQLLVAAAGILLFIAVEAADEGSAAGDAVSASAPASDLAFPASELAFVDAEGRVVQMLNAAAPRGAMLIVLSETCYLCDMVRPRLDDYRARLAPMRVSVVGQASADGRAPADADLGDLAMMASRTLGATTYPSAVIVLPDGTVAMPPIFGPEAIDDVVAELAASLAAQNPQN